MNEMQMIAATSVFLTWSLFCITLRFWVAWKYKPSIYSRASRWSSILTGCAGLTTVIVLILGLWRAGTEHSYSGSTDPTYVPIFGFPLHAIPATLKVLLAALLIYQGSLLMIKLAFVSMYFDLARHLTFKYKVLLYVTAAYVFLTFTTSIIMSFLFCHPLDTVWTYGPHYCNPISNPIYLRIYTVLNTTSDGLVMLVPILIVRNLNIRRGQAYAIAFLIFLGFLTVGATTARAVYILNLTPATTVANATAIRSNIHVRELLSELELVAALTAVCLPSLHILLKRRRVRGFVSSFFKSSRTEDSKFSGSAGIKHSRASSIGRPIVRGKHNEYHDIDAIGLDLIIPTPTTEGPPSTIQQTREAGQSLEDGLYKDGLYMK